MKGLFTSVKHNLLFEKYVAVIRLIVKKIFNAQNIKNMYTGCLKILSTVKFLGETKRKSMQIIKKNRMQ